MECLARLDLVIIALPSSGINTAHMMSSWRGCLFFIINSIFRQKGLPIMVSKNRITINYLLEPFFHLFIIFPLNCSKIGSESNIGDNPLKVIL